MSKTHYRKAFDSPYLSSEDVVEPIILTIHKVVLEADHTKKTKDIFNTAYFVEQEIRHGEKLKPMILNVVNSKTVKDISGSPYIDDWKNVTVKVFVDNNVKFGRETVGGLRLSPAVKAMKELTPDMKSVWDNAIKAFHRDGNLDKVKERYTISSDNEALILKEASSAVA